MSESTRRLRPSEREARVNRLASRQRGLVTRAQAEAEGVTERMRRARLKNGSWVRVFPSVFRLAAVPASAEQTLLAACLHAGDQTVVSHRSAGALWGLEGFALKQDQPLEVTTPRNARLKVVRVYPSARPRSAQVRHGIPVTSAARTLLDLCAVAPREVEHALNDALRRRLVTLPDLQCIIHLEAGRGVPGAALFRRLVGRLELAGKPTDSWLETSTAKLLDRAGLRPVRQHVVTVEGRRLRVDFAFPAQRVVLEAQGYRFHHSLDDWTRDQERQSALTAAGWRVLLVTARELKHRPEALLRRVRGLLATSVPCPKGASTPRGRSHEPPPQVRHLLTANDVDASVRAVRRTMGERLSRRPNARR